MFSCMEFFPSYKNCHSSSFVHGAGMFQLLLQGLAVSDIIILGCFPSDGGPVCCWLASTIDSSFVCLVCVHSTARFNTTARFSCCILNRVSKRMLRLVIIEMSLGCSLFPAELF